MEDDPEPDLPAGVRRFRLVAWRDRLFARLKACGVRMIGIRFTGGGDGGMFGTPRATDRKGEPVDLTRLRIDWPVEVSTLAATGNWERSSEIRKISAEQAVVKIADDISDAVIMNWAYECGGVGTFTIDLGWDRARVRLDVEDSGYLKERRVYTRAGTKLRLDERVIDVDEIMTSGLYDDRWDLPAELPRIEGRRPKSRDART